MPVEVKPLFRPDVLRPLVAAFEAPDPKGQQIEKLRRRAETFPSGKADSLNEKELVAEVRKVGGRSKSLSPAGLKALRGVYAETLQPLRNDAKEAEWLEARLSELVKAAYELTEGDEELLWATAPSRTPLTRPGSGNPV